MKHNRKNMLGMLLILCLMLPFFVRTTGQVFHKKD